MKLPKSYYNTLSLAGTVIAIVNLFLILLFFTVGFFFENTSSYLGLFIYIMLPGFLLIGLILIPIGMIIEVQRRKKREIDKDEKAWPILDFNLSRYRNAFVIFGVGTTFLFLLTGVGSYEAFHYTESVEFCGTLCHEVMKPEYATYQHSPHARVSCVACHVGSGADWYVRSKLSGLRQVYAVLTDDFSRPIPTPLHNLRPARETCEKCHWPEKFYERQLRNTKHYLADSLNTEWNISLQMKIGASHSAYGLTEGIHWHINPEVKIEYIPKRDNRKDIPWIKYTNLETGEETLYQDAESPLKEKKLAEAIPREMDCMDCHTRPSHAYFTPSQFVDEGLTNGQIPKNLPYIKRVAMDLFLYPYESTDTALYEIENYTKNYYKDNLPEIYDTRMGDINNSIEAIKSGFSRNIFPEMQASWDEYEDNIGHKTYNGCFRCHDDNHVSEDGKVISKDCNICHTIVLQGKPGEEQFANLNEAVDFIHPKKLKGGWEDDLCYDCHRYLYE